ncbi:MULTISPECIES: TRAP transporter small permease [unclassified Bradyrhizobium]
MIVVLLSVFYRYALHEPIEWAEEAARVLLIAVTFIGAASALRRDQLTGIEALLAKLPGHIHDYGKASVPSSQLWWPRALWCSAFGSAMR